MHCHRSDSKKRLLILPCLALAALAANAQPPREPLESPRAVASQVVGLEPIVVTYHSPGVKDREIWGALVPWGQNWRAGANDKTTIQFSEKVKIRDAELAAGTYGLYILPHGADQWEIVLNSDAEGSPNTFERAKDVLRVMAKPEPAEFRERLQWSIESFTDWPPFTAEIVLHWEKVRVVLPVEVLSDWKAP
ncbi:MAG: DUF2911 domain-containing protein [Acidobacteriota bacterium]